MGRTSLWALTMMMAGVALGCGSDDKGGSSASTAGSGGGAGRNTAGTAGAGAGGSAAGGMAGMAGMSGAGGGVDRGLDCEPATPMFGHAVPIPCNGKCLSKVGDESEGCRVLSRSFFKTSLVADAAGDTLFVTDAAILPEPDFAGSEINGPARIAVIDRVSTNQLGEVVPEGRPHVRAVSATQIAWLQVGNAGTTLEVAPLAQGVIGKATSFGKVSVNGINNPYEQIWFEGDQLFYEEYAGFGKALRRVPLSGGMPTKFEGLLNSVVSVPKLLAFGSLDSFDRGVHLLQLQETGEPTVLRQGVLGSQFSSATFAADATYGYYLDPGSSEDTTSLYRLALDGASAPEKLADHPHTRSIVAGDARGFVQYDFRYLWLVPTSGGERVKLADLGDLSSNTQELVGALLTPKHLIAIVNGDLTGPSSYLLEIPLPV